MRLFLAITTLFCVLSLSFIWFSRPAVERSLEGLVPEDILALAVLSEPPHDLSLLDQTRLQKWLELDSQSLQGVSSQLIERAIPLLTREVQETWLIIHPLTSKGKGTWRINFSAFLVPRPFQRPALEERIGVLAAQAFGPEAIGVADYDNVRIFRGRTPGQILYQTRMAGFLLVSNSPQGWQKILRTAAGLAPSLADNRSFRRVRNRLGRENGLFIYCTANRLFPFLPEFGYVLQWRGKEPLEKYWEVK